MSCPRTRPQNASACTAPDGTSCSYGGRRNAAACTCTGGAWDCPEPARPDGGTGPRFPPPPDGGRP
jgi:hypothetical protein